MPTYDELDPRTPVVIGVGQYAENIDDPAYEALSPIDLAVRAAEVALEDSGANTVIRDAIDVIASTRQFENSLPGAPAPLGRSSYFPRSVSGRLGINPALAVLEVSGGQSPQHLVNEFAAAIAAGAHRAVLLVGAEAMSTTRHLMASDGEKPDFSDEPEGDRDDRGYGLAGLVSREQVLHGLMDAPSQYSLLENARRARLGQDRGTYARQMGELFAPFTRVAAKNPYSSAPVERTADELVTVTEANRMIAEPYPRYLVARDLVNQSASVLLASVETARGLGVPEERWVFLHGQADLRERALMERVDLGRAPSAAQAVRHALEVAGLSIEEVRYLDLYSCFPIAVSNVADDLGIAPDDPRGLTLTGGLPFFGGPGNNYSMHAIAEAVTRTRLDPGTFALVGANGGVLSKYSVGVYSTTPSEHRADRSARLQREIDRLPAPGHAVAADGWARIETFTVVHRKSGPVGIVVGRLEADDRRFLSLVQEGDDALLELLRTADQPVGARIFARSYGYGNRVATDEATAERLSPTPVPAFQDSYEFIELRRDGHVLEVTLNRPERGNSLHPPAHEELTAIFDAFEADSELWVAIITGAGDKTFCAGNDLLYSASGKTVYVPTTGFAGLTSRRLTKPVIAAVNGAAFGGGFEIALACHLVVADANATFALSEVKVGLVAGAGGAVRLPRQIAPKFANELLLTGRKITAQAAHDLGIVNNVAEAGGAMAAARGLAAEIASVSPTSVRTTLAIMNATRGISDDVEAAAVQPPELDALLVSEDMFEGLMAFAQKRPPKWVNR